MREKGVIQQNSIEGFLLRESEWEKRGGERGDRPLDTRVAEEKREERGRERYRERGKDGRQAEPFKGGT